MASCTRKATCRCPDCVAASGLFSSKDLVAVASSKVVFNEEEEGLGDATAAGAVGIAGEAASPSTTAEMARKLRALKPKPAGDNHEIKPLVAPRSATKAPSRFVRPTRPAGPVSEQADGGVTVDEVALKPAPATSAPPSTSNNIPSQPALQSLGALKPVAQDGSGNAKDDSEHNSSLLSVDDENNPKPARRRLTGPRSSKVSLGGSSTKSSSSPLIGAAAPASSKSVSPALAMEVPLRPTLRADPECLMRPNAAAAAAAAATATAVDDTPAVKAPRETSRTAPERPSLSALPSQPSAAVAAAAASLPAGEDDDVVDLSLPLETRLTSTNWKLRKSAYEQIQNPSSRDVAEGLMANVERIVESEAHPSALDAGLDFARSVVAKSDKCADAEKLIVGLCKRALMARVGTKQRAMALVLELVSIEPEASVKALADGVGNKNAKMVVTCLSALREVLAAFGPPGLDTKALLSAMEIGMAATPPAIRAEATSLACDGVAWFGPAFKTLALARAGNDAQKRELERRFEAQASSAPPKATHVLKHAMVGGASASSGSSGSNGGGGALDVYSMLAANDLLGRLSEVSLEAKLKEPKWTDRKAALEQVLALCGSPPKLVPTGDYTPLVVTMRRVVTMDTNQAVVVQALQTLLGISEGLRSDFLTSARLIVPALLEKLREKKAPVIQAVNALFQSMVQWGLSVADERVVAQFDEALSKPTPLLVTHMMQLIERSVPEKCAPNSLAPLTALVQRHVAEPDPSARAAANAALAAIKQVKSDEAEAPAYPLSSSTANIPSSFPASAKTGLGPGSKKPATVVSATKPTAAAAAAAATSAAAVASSSAVKRPPTGTKSSVSTAASKTSTAAPKTSTTAAPTTGAAGQSRLPKPSAAVAASAAPPAPKPAAVELEALLPLLMADQALWKSRDAALDQLGVFLQSNGAAPLSLSRAVKDVGAALAKRVDDSQRNVGMHAVQLSGQLGKAVGGNASAQLLDKSLGEKLVLALGDSKKQIAAAAEGALTSFVLHDGEVHQGALAVIVRQSAAPVAGTKFLDKPRLLSWLCEHLPPKGSIEDGLKLALLDMVAPLVACVSAKDAPTRRAALQLGEAVAWLVPQLAPNRFRTSLRDLKEAQLRAVQPAIEDMLSRALARPDGEEGQAPAPVPKATTASVAPTTRSKPAPSQDTGAHAEPASNTSSPATPPDTPSEPPTPARFVATMSNDPLTPPEDDHADAVPAWDPTAPDVMEALCAEVEQLAGAAARDAMFSARVGVRTFELLDSMLDTVVAANPLPFVRWALLHFASRECSTALASNFVLFAARALSASADAEQLLLREPEVRVMVVLLASKLSNKQLAVQARRVFELLPRGMPIENVAVCIVAAASNDSSVAAELLDEVARLIAAHGHHAVVGKRLEAELTALAHRSTDQVVAKWAKRCLAGELGGDFTPVTSAGSRKGLLSRSVEQRLRGVKKPGAAGAPAVVLLPGNAGDDLPSTSVAQSAISDAPIAKLDSVDFSTLAADVDALVELFDTTPSPLRSAGRSALVIARAETAMDLIANTGHPPASWPTGGKSWDRHVEDSLPVDAIATSLCRLVSVLQGGVNAAGQVTRVARLAVAAIAALVDRRGLCLQMAPDTVRELVRVLCTCQQDNARLVEAMRAVATSPWLRESKGWLAGVLGQPIKADLRPAIRSFLAGKPQFASREGALADEEEGEHKECVALARLRTSEDPENGFILEALLSGRLTEAKSLIEAIAQAHDSGRVEHARASIVKLHALGLDLDNLLEGRPLLLRVYIKQRIDDLTRLDRLKLAVQSSPGSNNARLERLRSQVLMAKKGDNVNKV